MLKKITAVGLITLFAGVTAAPFISLDDCNMSCCAVIETSCCEMDQEMTCPTMTDCGASVFVLIVSGPFHKSELKSSDSITRRIVTDLNIFKIETNYVPHFGNFDPGPMASMNLPLLI
tara:strand:+ start:157 stop:510 length:354 start_codon:yes stop_codon:yes gene_type:complete